jgi:hypothetical protein
MSFLFQQLTAGPAAAAVPLLVDTGFTIFFDAVCETLQQFYQFY